jgi:DNA-binding NtrC family response regulator
MRYLCTRDWPGNVRELANVIARAVALTEHDAIVLEDVREQHPSGAAGGDLELAAAAARHVPLAQIELAYVKHVIAAVGGNMAHAARVLGIDRRTLYRKLADAE